MSKAINASKQQQGTDNRKFHSKPDFAASLYIDKRKLSTLSYVSWSLNLKHKCGDKFGTASKVIRDGYDTIVRAPSTPTRGSDDYKIYSESAQFEVDKLNVKELVRIQAQYGADCNKTKEFLISKMSPSFRSEYLSHPLTIHVDSNITPSKDEQKQHSVFVNDSKDPNATVERKREPGIIIKPVIGCNILLMLAIIRSIALNLSGDSGDTVKGAWDSYFQRPDANKVIPFLQFVEEYKELRDIAQSVGKVLSGSVLTQHFLDRVDQVSHGQAVLSLITQNPLPDLDSAIEFIKNQNSQTDRIEAQRLAHGLPSLSKHSSSQVSYTTSAKVIPTRAPTRPCKHCNGNHWDSDCQHTTSTTKCPICHKQGHGWEDCYKVKALNDNKSNIPENSNVSSKSIKNLKKAFKALYKQTEDDDVVSALIVSAQEYGQKATSGNKDSAYMVKSNVVSIPFQINWDNNTSVNIIKDAALMQLFDQCNHSRTLYGIVGDAHAVIDQCGLIFGNVPADYYPDGHANLVNPNILMRHGWSVRRKNDGTDIAISPDAKIIIRTKINKDNVSVIDSINNVDVHTYCTKICSCNEISLLSVSKLNRKKEEFESLWKSLNYPHPNTFANMFKAGSIINTKTGITHLDAIKLSKELDSNGIREIATSRDVQNKESSTDIAFNFGDVIHADIFFDRLNQAYLLTADRAPSGFYTITKLETSSPDINYIATKSASAIVEAVKSVQSLYKGHGYAIKSFVPDCENNFRAARNGIYNLGINASTTSAPGKHNKIAESATRIIKQRTSIIASSCHIKMPDTTAKNEVQAAVSAINLEPKTGESISPMEAFVNRKINLQHQKFYQYGTFAVIHQDKSLWNKDHHTPGEYGIILNKVSESNDQFFCYMIGRKSIIIASIFSKLLPGPLPFWGFKPNPITHTREQKDQGRDITEVEALDPLLEVQSDNESDSDTASESESLSDTDSVVDEQELPITESAEPEGDTDVTISADRNNVTTETTVVTNSGDRINPVVQHAHEGDTETQAIHNLSNARKSKFGRQYKPTQKLSYHANSNSIVFDPGGASIYQVLQSSHADCEFHIVKAYRSFVKKTDLATNSPTYEAIYKELLQMFTRKVFHSVKLEDISSEYRHKIIGSLMFLKDKYSADGTFDKVKARLAARGDQQLKTIYTEDSSSPTVNLLSLYTLLSFAARKKAHVSSFDIPGAFLNGDLVDDNHIYLKLPKECGEIWSEITKNHESISKDGNSYVKLNKALYGLQEASSIWFAFLKAYLLSIGYNQSNSDPCVFYTVDKDSFEYLCVYVDDILQITNDKSNSSKLFDLLQSQFGKHGDVTYQDSNNISFLGLNIIIEYEKGYIEINQNNHVRNILSKYKLNSGNNYPSNENLFNESTNSNTVNRLKFLSVLMELMYVAIRSRPDILKEISFLATKSMMPTEGDLSKLHHVLQYLYKFPTKSLFFICDGGNNLEIYTDASWGLHPETHGHSGILIKLYGNSIIFKSVKQKLVTKSSTEAELVAIDDGITYIYYLLEFIHEIEIDFDQPAILFQDNKSTITWCREGKINFKRTKHIKNRYFFVKQLIDNGKLSPIYLNTLQMLADFFTKPLVGFKFNHFLSKVLNSSIIKGSQ